MKEIPVKCKECKLEITLKVSEEELKRFSVKGCIIIQCQGCDYYNIVKIKE